MPGQGRLGVGVGGAEVVGGDVGEHDEHHDSIGDAEAISERGEQNTYGADGADNK